jgi:epsilon-lactone hydrolase
MNEPPVNAVAGLLARLPGERAGHPPPIELAHRRRMMAAAVESGAWRTRRLAQRESLEGVPVLRHLPAHGRRGIVLHMHGGGFRIGCPEMVAPFATALAEQCEVEVICPTYRLAPEHPFPAAILDTYRVLNALHATSREPIFVSGDSAGGGLAAALTCLCVSQGIPIHGLVLLSPWLDLTLTSSTFDTNAATDPMFSRAAALEAASLYLQGHSPEDPTASPLFADVTGFPPTLISISEAEVLADDGRHFAAALCRAGVRARLVPVAGMEHTAVTRDLTLPGAPATFQAIAAFIDSLFLTQGRSDKQPRDGRS